MARDSLIWKSDLSTNNSTQQYTKPVGDTGQSVFMQSSMVLVPVGSGPSKLLMGFEPMFPESDSQSHLVINKGSLSFNRSIYRGVHLLCGHCSLVQLSDWRSRPWHSFPPVPGVGWVHSLLRHMVQSTPHGDHLLHSLQPPSTEHTRTHMHIKE